MKISSDVVLITNISVIDATGSPPQEGMNVLIEDGYISALSTEPIPAKADVAIDGSGQFLIPGLWDMHVHWYEKDYLSLFIANGVTGVRQMWGSPVHYQWKTRINYEPEFVSPRMLVASTIIDGPNEYLPTALVATNASEGRRYVRRFHEMGADFIKVYNSLSRDAYFAIADESRALGIPFAGHLPWAIAAPEASDAGHRSFEHLMGMSHALAAQGSLREFLATTKATDDIEWSTDFIEGYDPVRASDLFDRFKKNDSWQCPTLTYQRNLATYPERVGLDRDRLAFLPQFLIDTWDPSKNPGYSGYIKARVVQVNQIELEHYKFITGQMSAAGVRIIAGTDVLNPYCFPGFSLHDELQLLVEAGLTPMQAIQAATRSAAEFSGRLDLLGTVEVGKIADLVILSANPLDDIENTTKISNVIFNGRVNTRVELDAMLGQAHDKARASDTRDA
jgi:hypothetical protein|tara:strand:- start:3146 stop:4495 length:1350 start_codon:yes stop_codon:yes gene_type:complete